MSRTIDELLREAPLHFDVASRYGRAGESDGQMALDAMTMRLFAGLEALTQLPDDVADRLFRDQWPDMRGLRNRIAHGYGAMNLTRVRATVAEDLPDAVAAIVRELN